MRRTISLFVLLVTPLLVGADTDDDVRKELKALQGSWKITSAESDGKPLAKEAIPEFTFIIGADGKSTGKTANTEYSSKITIDPKKDPKSIEHEHLSGDQKGKSSKASTSSTATSSP